MANKPALVVVGRSLRVLQHILVWIAWTVIPPTPGLARLQILFIECFLPRAVLWLVLKISAAQVCVPAHLPAQLHPVLSTDFLGAA